MESNNNNIEKENIFNRLFSFNLINEDLVKHKKLSEKLLFHSQEILKFFRDELSGRTHQNPEQALVQLLDQGINQFSHKPFIKSDIKSEKYALRMAYVDLLKEMKDMVTKKGISYLNEVYVNTKWSGAGGISEAWKVHQEIKSKKK